ncbi:MAG: hypothetical protein ACYC2I_01725 [Elusimicrobiales bacterium]
MLKSALLVLLAASPAVAESLPVFNMNSVRVSDLSDHSFNNVLPKAELFPIPPGQPDKASYIQMTSSIKMKMDKEKGDLTIGFPKAAFGDAGPGDKAHLFVKMTRGLPAPSISWATVLCSDGHFLGYKGSNLNLPEQSGNFSISETLALGSPKRLISRTHPWLAGDLADLEEVCSEPFLAKMKDARAETLPQKLGEFSFDYNPKKNTLKVSWDSPR